MNTIEKWLGQYFDELTPDDFYWELFPSGELEENGKYETGRYNAIGLCISQKETKWDKRKDEAVPKVYRYTMTDDHDLIDELTERDDLFCLMSPLTYAGKNRTSQNARFLYAMAFDIDYIRFDAGEPVGLMDLWNGQIVETDRLPKPTVIVSSGTGVHLYYMLEKPVPLFPNIVKQLQSLKHELTRLLWNEGIVDIHDDREIQYEGIFQGFRMVGTLTKEGSRAKAYLTGNKVTIEYLNGYVDSKYRVTEYTYKSEITRAEAKERFPDWYEKRIVQGQKGILNPWALNRSVYEYWKKVIWKEARVGHRYYCLMMLSVYAMKCSHYDEKKNPDPVTREELEHDAMELLSYFDSLTISEDNHFSASDVIDALDAYDAGMMTYPRRSVEYHTGIDLLRLQTEENRRKGVRKSKEFKKRYYETYGREYTQEDHLSEIRELRDIRMKRAGKQWNGRHDKSAVVMKWRKNHPSGTKAQCIRETGITKPTVYKWWDGIEDIQ